MVRKDLEDRYGGCWKEIWKWTSSVSVKLRFLITTRGKLRVATNSVQQKKYSSRDVILVYFLSSELAWMMTWEEVLKSSMIYLLKETLLSGYVMQLN